MFLFRLTTQRCASVSPMANKPSNSKKTPAKKAPAKKAPAKKAPAKKAPAKKAPAKKSPAAKVKTPAATTTSTTTRQENVVINFLHEDTRADAIKWAEDVVAELKNEVVSVSNDHIHVDVKAGKGWLKRLFSKISGK